MRSIFNKELNWAYFHASSALTDEKCQLSCFYFLAFALFIWFISAYRCCP